MRWQTQTHNRRRPTRRPTRRPADKANIAKESDRRTGKEWKREQQKRLQENECKAAQTVSLTAVAGWEE